MLRQKGYRLPFMFMLMSIMTVLLLNAGSAQSTVTPYAQDLAGFNVAAGNPPISINFDGFKPGTDITNITYGGITFQGPGAPLIVVRGSDTYTPLNVFSGVIDASTNKLTPTSGENVLSPGGIVLGPGPNNAIENDSLTLIFLNPVKAFGFDHLSQSADGYSFSVVTAVYDSANNVLYSGPIPISNIGNVGGGAAGGADFWGIVSSEFNIAKIVITESDNNDVYPDCNIGFDTFRYNAVPLPGAAWLLGSGLLGLAGWRRFRKS